MMIFMMIMNVIFMTIMIVLLSDVDVNDDVSDDDDDDDDDDPPALPDPPAHILSHTQPAAFQHACLSQHLDINISWKFFFFI